MAYSSPPTTPVRRPTKERDQDRPASPSPSASGFSLIGPEEAIDYNEFWTYNTSSRRAAVYSTPTLNYFSSSSSSSSPFSWSLNSSPNAGLRGLFPRLWDVLVSSPTKNILSPSPRQPQSQRQYSIYGTYPRSKRRCSSENMLPIPFPVQATSSSPDPYTPSSHVSRPPIQPLHRPSFSSISSQSSSSSYTYINYSDLLPLDGEEGELVDVDDEACFLPSRHSKLHNGNYLGGNYIWTCRYNCRLTCNHPMSWRPRQSFSRARVITGIDIVGLLPTEIALEVFLYVATAEISWASADEIRRTSADALEDILMCMNVNKIWRALAVDNSVWKTLFEGRWVGGITTSESRLSRYRERQKTRRPLDPREKSLPPIPGSVEEEVTELLPNVNYLDLYRERFELDKRWAGTAFTKRIITPSFFSSPSPVTTPTSSSNTITPISTSTSSSTATSAYNSVSSSPTTTTHLPLPSPDEDLSSPFQYYAQSFGRPFSLAAHYTPAHGFGTNGTLTEEQWDKFEPGIVRLEGHSDSVYCVEFVTASPLRLSPKWWDPLADDDEHIITGSRDKTIKLWSLRTGRCVGTFGNSSTSVSPSQRLAQELEVEGHSGSVLCLKFFWLDNEPEEELDKGKGKAGERTFHSRRGVVYSGSSDRTVCVWDVWTEAAEGDAGFGYVVKARVSTVLRGHHGGVLDLRVDDKYIVSCSKDAAIRVWHRSSLSRAASASSTDLSLTTTQEGPHANLTLRGHEGPVNAVGLEGGRVVSASGDGKMILWDVVSGEKIRTFEGHDRGLACIEFKDNLIISGSNDCKIKIWSVTGECLRTLEGHESLVRTLAFDSQRGILVSASYDKSVRVWDVRDVCAGNGRKMKDGVPKSKQLREFRNAHTSHIFDVRFDARRIVSTSHDQKIVVADFARGLDGAELFI